MDPFRTTHVQNAVLPQTRPRSASDHSICCGGELIPISTRLVRYDPHQRRLQAAYGRLDFTDSGELNDTGTFDKANKWTARDIDTSGGNNYTLAYDGNGSMTSDRQSY